MKGNIELKERFLEYFRKVPIQKFAAGYIGRSEDTITDWKKNDKDFSDCIDLAKAEFVSAKMNKVRSNEWILERIFKGDFAQRNEHTGKDGESLKPTFVVQTTEAKKELEKLYEGSDSSND